MKPPDAWDRCADWVGISLDSSQNDQLTRFSVWLGEEAIAAGGLGPGEADRIDTRHIGDSLLFARPMESPERIVDFGSGVGLPGIPLAILFPDAEVILIDRSDRRCDLARRAARILRLENVQVIRGEIGAIPENAPYLVSRATLPPDQARDLLGSRLGPGEVLMIGGSWQRRPRDNGWTVIAVPESVLDRPIWLLMMRGRE